MTEGPCCGTCRFWLEAGADKVCRRYPPTVTFLPAVQDVPPRTISYFPGMQPEGWCGEFSPRGAPSEVVIFPVPGDGTQRLP